MRMLMNITMPHEPFNTAVRNGTVGQIMRKIFGAINPEAVFFTEQNGKRGAVVIVNVNKASDIPALAEPWFLNFHADCELRIAMTPEDLQLSGIDEIGKKWA
jgi:hypothetical protein